MCIFFSSPCRFFSFIITQVKKLHLEENSRIDKHKYLPTRSDEKKKFKLPIHRVSNLSTFTFRERKKKIMRCLKILYSDISLR